MRKFLKFTSLFALLSLVLPSAVAESKELDNSVTKEITRQGRDYSSYYPDDDKAKFSGYAEYPPSNYVSYKEDIPANCPPSPLIPALSSGLNFLLLKLGAIGVIKAVIAVIFFVFLLKLPILLAKAAFLKAFVFPALLAPLMMLFSGKDMMDMMMKPNKPDNDNNQFNNNNQNGRALNEFSESAWQSFKFLLDSDKCAERMACKFGEYNNDTLSGENLTRMIKYVEASSPHSVQPRLRSLRDAFTDGNTGGFCSDDFYPCQSPHLLVSRGDATYKIL